MTPPLGRTVRVTHLAAVAAAASVAVGGMALGRVSSAQAAAARPLQTAIFDTEPYEGSNMQLGFTRTREAGASAVRLHLQWSSIAPSGDTKPDGFDPQDPADPAYDWSQPDAQVSEAVGAGLSPILVFSHAPLWAEQEPSSYRPGSGRPSPSAFRDFTLAAARRYSGDFGGLPRVGSWEVWNEANLYHFLTPQYDTPLTEPVTADSHPVSPEVYRPLVNAMAASVHAVHRDNVVVAGGLAPFGRFGAKDHAVPPLQFMRQLLCLSPKNRPLRRCHERTRFDAWAVHPYTQGGPSHKATYPDNVSLGDLPRMRRVLLAAERAGRVVSRKPADFWVTEFSWDSKPPDPWGLPLKRHARWLSESFYRMWDAGVTLVTWFQLRDGLNRDVPKSREYTSGLYLRCEDGLACDKPKPALRAFRFPFVALPRGPRNALVWGRTPTSRRAKVIVSQRTRRGWRRRAVLRANRHGIFMDRIRRRGKRPLRAVASRTRSLPFSPTRTRDIPVNPFGGPTCERPERESRLCP
jgi:hypothetical protein